jgi:hypothetical protein
LLAEGPEDAIPRFDHPHYLWEMAKISNGQAKVGVRRPPILTLGSKRYRSRAFDLSHENPLGNNEYNSSLDHEREIQGRSEALI